MSSSRERLVTGLKYGLGLAVLGWLAAQIEWGQVAQLLRRLDASTIGSVMAVTVLGLLGRFYTWQALIGRQDLSLADAGRVDLAVNFINQLFPSRLSGRSAAPVFVRRYSGVDWAAAVSVTGFHTALYAALYGVAAAAGIWFAWSELSKGLILLLGVSVAVYVGAAVAIVAAGLNLTWLEGMTDWLRRQAKRLPVGADRAGALADKVPSFTAETASKFAKLLYSPGPVAGYTAGWALAMLIAPGLRFWLLLEGLGANFPAAVLLPLYLVMAYSVTLLPLTPGGIGVSEATATLVFVSLGIPETVVVPIVFLDRVLGVYLPALLGAVPAMTVDISDATS